MRTMRSQIRFAIPKFRILASSIPLILMAVLARHQAMPASRPCIAVGDISVQVSSEPWQAHVRVAFTDDPARATVRVRIVNTPETADFSVVDDIDSADAGVCRVTAATRYVGIATASTSNEPLIYLTDHGDADYLIFVRSNSFSPREAAALIVGAQGGRPHLATASL
jgi:hypothetical protein